MLLRFFRSNQLLEIPVIAVLALCFWGFAFAAPAETLLPSNALLLRPMLQWFIDYPLAGRLITITALILQAFYLNYIIDQHRLISKRNYLPALIFVVLASSNTFYSMVLPIALSNFFLLPAIHRMLAFSNSGPGGSAAFDAGFLVAIGSFFFPPITIGLLLVFVALASLRAFAWREWALVLIGFGLPHLFAWVWLYWTDQLRLLMDHLFALTLFRLPQFGPVTFSLVAFLAILAWIGFVGLAPYLKSISVNTVRVKRSLVVFVWMLVLLLPTWIFTGYHLRASGILFAIPISIYMANYFTFVRNKWLAELLLILLILGNLLHQLEAHL